MSVTVNGLSSKEIREAYEIAAQLVVKYGDAHLPVFERMYKEVQNTKKKQNLKDLALFVITGNLKSEAGN
jgi:hypothetical protein